MAVWLRSAGMSHDSPCVAFDGDVVPNSEFADLMSIHEACERVAQDRAHVIARAHREAEALMRAAQEQARAMLDEASRKYEGAAADGYRAGEREALSEWTERLAQTRADERMMQTRMRERLAEIVALAVEQIVQVEHIDSLFDRALDTIDRIVDGAAFLRIAVNPENYQAACRVFDRLSRRWQEAGRPFPLEVVADSTLDAGSCVCESDFGTVDASLVTQMRAMRSAILKAVKLSAREELDEPDDGVRASHSVADDEERPEREEHDDTEENGVAKEDWNDDDTANENWKDADS
jgi:type III secretion protein L